ncbi:MAG: thioesterase [Candidatus Hydrogenedentota bacterium]
MAIWKYAFTLDDLNARCSETLAEHLAIEFIEFGDDFIKARMPVDRRTRQPAGLLHGGASVALAETIGSMAANLCVDIQRFMCVGLEINANHVRPVTHGYVIAEARALHIGKSTHVWDIKLRTEEGKLACVSRLTMAVLAHSE